ncbi:MAG: hypothetical protein ABJA02_10275 [Acidobacteriota bacterium]
MSAQPDNLGRLVGIFGPSAAQTQRAVFTVVLSFLFFIAMMFASYTLQNFIYFLLASAFLVVYLVTLSSLISQRRNIFRLYEGGFESRRSSYRWDEVESVRWITGDRSRDLQIVSRTGKTIAVPASINDVDTLAEILKSKIAV